MKNNSETQAIFGLRAAVLIGLSLLAGTTFKFPAGWMWHDQHRIDQVFLLIVTALACSTIWRKALLTQLGSLPTSIRWMLGLAFALGCASAGLSAYPRLGGLEWATFLLLAGLGLVVANQARDAGVHFDTLAVRIVVALAILIASKVMIMYVSTFVQGVRLDTTAIFGAAFSNRRTFGQIASMAIPLLAYPLLARKLTPIQQWALFALLAIWWMLVIVSGTRGTWLALAVAATILAAFAWQASKNWLRIQAVALGAGGLLFSLLFLWLPTWLGAGATLEDRLSDISNLNGRGELWALAWSQVKTHPLLGTGPMHFAAAHNKFGAHPHNAILQLAAEWGLPAAVALVFPIAIGLLRLLAKLRQSSSNTLLVCLTAGLLAAGVQSMVDGVIVIPYTQTWLALVAGWTLGVYFRDCVSTFPPRAMEWGIPVLATVSLIVLLNGVFPEILNRAEANKAFIDAGHPFPPRYWAVGQIP